MSEELDFKYSMICLLIMCVGLFGNILNLIVFSRRSMRKITTFRYLLYLSITDIFVLVIGATDASLTFGFNIQIRLTTVLACKLHTFSTYFLTHMSSILLTLVSVERAIVVCNAKLLRKYSGSIYNYRLGSSIKNYHVEIIISVIALILIGIDMHYIIYLDLNYMDQEHDDISTSINNLSMMCFPSINSAYYNFLSYIWVWIDMCIYSLIPFSIMVICSSVILFKIKFREKRSSIGKKAIERRSKRNKQILTMLTMTNFYFIICSLPLCIVMVCKKLEFEIFDDETKMEMIQTFFNILAYSNNAFNFIFFIIFSEKYRSIICQNDNNQQEFTERGNNNADGELMPRFKNDENKISKL
jgi:hypothetical protein